MNIIYFMCEGDQMGETECDHRFVMMASRGCGGTVTTAEETKHEWSRMQFRGCNSGGDSSPPDATIASRVSRCRRRNRTTADAGTKSDVGTTRVARKKARVAVPGRIADSEDTNNNTHDHQHEVIEVHHDWLTISYILESFVRRSVPHMSHPSFHLHLTSC